MGLFTTYKGLENEQNVKYKNIPFNEDNSFNSQPFIQTAPPGDGGGFKVASNVKGFIPKLTSGLTAGALNLTDGLSKTVPSLGAIARGAYRSATDVVRLTKFMTTPSGIEFILKQELLSRMAVQTEISGVSNGGLYNPLATLAQAGVSFAGLHLPTLTNINGEKLYDPSLGYGPVAYAFSKANPDKFSDNRLVSIYKKNITSETKNPNTLLSYSGGPGSVFGIGSTTIKFATQPDGVTPVRTMGANFIYPQDEFNTPATYMAMYEQDSKTIYEQENIKIESIETRYGLGNPGRKEYDSSIGKYIQRSSITNLDTVNGQVIYSSTVTGNVKEKIDVATNDLVTFKIGILDVGGIKTNYMHFRSFIDSFSDSYNSDWSSQTYMGRGEKLYKYNSFDRSINISFTVAAQSRGEMAGMYQKLNYLASTVTPQYTDNGYMTGNIAKLTVGNYVKDQHGKIDSLSFEIPEESPWLVSTIQYQKQQAHDLRTVINELPFIIKVQMRFTPIHDFRPELATNALNGKFGDQRYITQVHEPKDTDTVDTNVSTKFGGDQPEVSVIGKIKPNTPPPQGKLRPLFTTLETPEAPPSLYPRRIKPFDTIPPTDGPMRPYIPRDTNGDVLFFTPNQSIPTKYSSTPSSAVPLDSQGNVFFNPSQAISNKYQSDSTPPTSKTSTKTPPDPNKKSPKHQNILRRLFKPTKTSGAYSG